jgi:hypothetical protein
MSKALLCLVFSILSFMMSFVIMRRLSYPEIDSEDTCAEPAGSTLKEGDECHVWDGSICRRGNIVNNDCVSEGNPLPLYLMLAGFLLLVASAVLHLTGDGKGKDGKDGNSSTKSGLSFGVGNRYRSW